MGAGKVFVEVDAQARRRGRRDIAVFPGDRLADQRQVKLAARQDGFDHQQVRDGGGKVNIGGPFHRPGVKMRRDLGVVGLGEGRDLETFPDTARAPQRRLQDIRRAGCQHLRELGLGGQPFAGGHGHAGGGGDLRHRRDVVGRHRFFEPERGEGFDRARQPDRAAGGELAVGAEKQVGPVADGFADRLAERHRARDVTHRRLVAAVDRVGPGGVELHRRKAQRHHFGGTFGGHLGRDPEIGQRVAGLRVEVGVGPQTFVHAPAEQRPDRAVAGLAEDVPAGDFQPGKRAHDAQVRALGETGGIGAAEHQLDVFRVFALHVAGEHVLDHRAHRGRADR